MATVVVCASLWRHQLPLYITALCFSCPFEGGLPCSQAESPDMLVDWSRLIGNFDRIVNLFPQRIPGGRTEKGPGLWIQDPGSIGPLWDPLAHSRAQALDPGSGTRAPLRQSASASSQKHLASGSWCLHRDILESFHMAFHAIQWEVLILAAGRRLTGSFTGFFSFL